mmetsp:Transcript_3687/g.5618  ORF Transcript_3687/g.5618 Transcript_3687/m.5618 type:complete len:202 (-) Transcript_3687:2608-3213(-)
MTRFSRHFQTWLVLRYKYPLWLSQPNPGFRLRNLDLCHRIALLQRQCDLRKWASCAAHPKLILGCGVVSYRLNLHCCQHFRLAEKISHQLTIAFHYQILLFDFVHKIQCRSCSPVVPFQGSALCRGSQRTRLSQSYRQIVKTPRQLMAEFRYPVHSYHFHGARVILQDNFVQLLMKFLLLGWDFFFDWQHSSFLHSSLLHP